MYKIIITTILLAVLNNPIAQAQTPANQDPCLKKLQSTAKDYDPQPVIALAKKVATILNRQLPKHGIFLNPAARAQYFRVVNGLPTITSPAEKLAFVKSIATEMIPGSTVKSKRSIAPLQIYVVPDPLITSVPLATLYGRYPTELELWAEMTSIPESNEELENSDFLHDHQSADALFKTFNQGRAITPTISLRSTAHDHVLAHEFAHFCQFTTLAVDSDPLTAHRVLNADQSIILNPDSDITMAGWLPILPLIEWEVYQLQVQLGESPSPEEITHAMQAMGNIFDDLKGLKNFLGTINDENEAKLAMKARYKKTFGGKAREKIGAIVDKIPFVALAHELETLAAEFDALSSTPGYSQFASINDAPRAQLVYMAITHGIDPTNGLEHEHALHNEMTLDMLEIILRRMSEK